MIVSSTTYYTTTSKPFFMPWQDCEISYDALLGVSFTIAGDIKGDIYLTTYIKTVDRLVIGFDLYENIQDDNIKIIPIIREDIHLQEGITLVLPTPKSNAVQNCSLTVINSHTIESYYGDPIQISPKYIHTAMTHNPMYLAIQTDNGSKNIDITHCTLNTENLDSTILNGTLDIKYDETISKPEIVDTIPGIQSINDNRVVDGVITINTSNTYLQNMLTAINESNSCIAVKLPSYTLCDNNEVYYSYFDPRNRKNESPLDICFTTPSFTFKPERIDDIQFTHNKLQWYLL